MKKRSANVLGATQLSRPSKLSSIDGGLVRHKLNINSYNSTHSKLLAPSTETYSVSNSSFLLGQSTAVDGGRPNIKVESLDQDEGIVYKGTFDSQKRRNTRITLYSARITPDETNVPLQLQL